MAIEKVELKDALNALVTNTNIDKVTGVLGGVPSNIAKADLASVMAGVMGSPTLGIKGALNGYQRITITAGQAIEITSQNVYTPLGINVYGIASGIRASYNVLYTEYNPDGGQTPAVLKLGMSWANPAKFYFKRTSNANSLVIKAHNNGNLIVDISGGTSNTLIINNISDISGYTTIEPVVYNFGCNTLDELAAALKPKLGL